MQSAYDTLKLILKIKVIKMLFEIHNFKIYSPAFYFQSLLLFSYQEILRHNKLKKKKIPLSCVKRDTFISKLNYLIKTLIPRSRPSGHDRQTVQVDTMSSLGADGDGRKFAY